MGDRGGSSPFIRTKGYRQAVRHKTLTLARDSSNLSTPAKFMVAIVQLVERQIVVLVVVGSSPSSHPSYVAFSFLAICDVFLF